MGTRAQVGRYYVTEHIDLTGGARRDRTADLLHAMQALSQLSYGPTRKPRQPTQPPRPCQAWPGWAPASAASNRASERSRPRSASVASIGGETALPVTATRTGCATLPRPTCSCADSWFSRPLIEGASHWGRPASCPRTCASTVRASAVRCFATAFGSISMRSEKKKRLLL